MKKKDYPKLDEEKEEGMVSDSVPYPYSADDVKVVDASERSRKYHGFYTEDEVDFLVYKFELISEALSDGKGYAWDEVKQQIKEQSSPLPFMPTP